MTHCNSRVTVSGYFITAVVLLLFFITPKVLAWGGDDLDCVIEASEISEVSSSVRGIMAAVEVKHGDWVEKGQVLAKLESSVEQATVDMARVRAQATRSIQARQARLDFTNKRLQRVENLSKSKAVAPQDLDEVETDQILAKIDLEQAREEVRLAKLDLVRVENMLALRTIKSPISGVVAEIYTSAGESVEDRPIMRLVQIDPLHVEVIAPVQLFGTVKEGDVSMVFPEEPIGGQLTATVSMVERIIDAPSGTFGLRLVLENKDRTLPAGLRCKLQLGETE